MIELRNVTVRAGARPVLAGLDLDVGTGDSCGIGGGNGSGRTTLLRVCAGLLRPASGSVRVAGVDARRSPRELRRHIGYLPQRAGAIPAQTVREELEVVAACHGIGASRRRAIAADLLELTGLTERTDSDVAKLSPGLHRRLLLARALVHDPAVLLLDAADAGLDQAGTAELAVLLGELREMGKTLLVVAAAPLVSQACDVVLELSGGRLQRARRGEVASEVPA